MPVSVNNEFYTPPLSGCQREAEVAPNKVMIAKFVPLEMGEKSAICCRGWLGRATPVSGDTQIEAAGADIEKYIYESCSLILVDAKVICFNFSLDNCNLSP